MNIKDKIIEIDMQNIVETDEAIMFSDGDIRAWVPKSQLEDWPDAGETGTVLIQEWIAEEKGFI